jgi:hypothetical protein
MTSLDDIIEELKNQPQASRITLNNHDLVALLMAIKAEIDKD